MRIFLMKALRLGSSELSETVINIQNYSNCGLMERAVFFKEIKILDWHLIKFFFSHCSPDLQNFPFD